MDSNRPDYEAHAASLDFACGEPSTAFTLVAEKVVDCDNGDRCALGLGVFSHRQHQHLVLVQLQRAETVSWHLHSAAHTEVRQWSPDALVVLDVRGSGCFGIGARASGAADVLRMELGPHLHEAKFEGGVALLATVVPIDADTPTVEIVDVDGAVRRNTGVLGSGELGTSHYR